MDLSVIIASFNRADTVGHTLASIRRGRGEWRTAIVLNAGAAAPAR